jgi:hypothetical protein
MNRAMRRAAARAKPLEYQRVDLPRHLDELAVFGDIERVLEKIEHGEIEFSQGVPVMLASDGGWYEVIPALNGWISVWKAFDQKFQLGHDLSALVRLCNCLNYNQPLREDQVRAAKPSSPNNAASSAPCPATRSQAQRRRSRFGC